MKALIIEDNKIMAQAIANWLSVIVEEVVVVEKMEDALREIEKIPLPEIVTIDLSLPDSHSDATRERIAEFRQRMPDAIMVVLTGIATVDDEEIYRQRGADGLIEKMQATNANSFYSKFRDIVRGLIKQPERFKKNLAILERLAHLVAKDISRSTSVDIQASSSC